MARIQTGAVITDIRGKLGGSIFQQTQGGLSIRNSSTPVNKHSAVQSSRRALLFQLQSNWRSLTDNQRTVWQQWADYQILAYGRFKTSGYTGHMAYIQINFYLSMLGQTLIDTPVWTAYSLPNLLFDDIFLTDNLVARSTESPFQNSFLIVARISAPLSGSQITRPSRLRFISAQPLLPTTWTVRTSAANNDWISVCYSNCLFVAVSSSGTGNRVMTSPDGITWTIRTSAADNNWRSVCYGNGLFVAVSNTGTGNRVMTSPDGITWTLRTSAADNDWISVCYSNGLFAAVSNTGTGNRIMTSPDGITWTIRTSAADNYWYNICYGNGLFVAVSSSGTNNRVMTSSYYPINFSTSYISIYGQLPPANSWLWIDWFLLQLSNKTLGTLIQRRYQVLST
jgi:hypothetical protein